MTLTEHLERALEEARVKPPLPRSKKAWQLISTAKGAGQAVPPLNASLKTLWKVVHPLLKRAYETNPNNFEREAERILSGAFYQHVVPVLSKFSSVGAGDTEPHTVAKDWIESMVAAHFDVYGQLDF